MADAIKQKVSIWILLTLVIPPLMVGVDLMIMGVAIEPLAVSLGVSISLLQWLLAGYAIGNASFYVIAGKLADMFGAKKIVNIGLLAFAIFSAAIALSDNIYWIIAFRILQGAFGSFIIIGALTWVAKSYEPEKRGVPTSAIVAGTGLGMSLGPVMGGLLIHFFSWRMAFWVNVPIAFIAMIFVSLLMKRRERAMSEIHFDIIGLVLLVISMMSLTVYLSQGDNWGWLSHRALIVLAVFVVALIALLIAEAVIKHSLLDYPLFRVRQFFAGSFIAMLGYFIMIAWLFVFGIYLQSVYGFSALEAGLAFLPFSVVFFITAYVLTQIADKLNPKIVAITAFVLMALSTLSLAFVHECTPYWYITIGFALMAFGFVISTSLLVKVTMRHMPPEKTGLANGKMMMIRWFGSSLGAAVISTIFEQTAAHFLDRDLSHYPSLMSPELSGKVLYALKGSLPARQVKAMFPGHLYTDVSALLGHSYSHALRVSMWVLFGVAILGLILSIVWLEGRKAPDSVSQPQNRA